MNKQQVIEALSKACSEVVREGVGLREATGYHAAITDAISIVEQMDDTDYNYDGCMADLDSLVRVALQNPAGLREFIRMNYPKEFAEYGEVDEPKVDEPQILAEIRKHEYYNGQAEKIMEAICPYLSPAPEDSQFQNRTKSLALWLQALDKFGIYPQSTAPENENKG